jgi:hypothetical protein
MRRVLRIVLTRYALGDPMTAPLPGVEHSRRAMERGRRAAVSRGFPIGQKGPVLSVATGTIGPARRLNRPRTSPERNVCRRSIY